MGIEKKYDVTALGELLIDFTESGLSEQGNKLLEVNPGGAPCNVLARAIPSAMDTELDA
jgi:fructokinase